MNTSPAARRDDRGFTLIELLVVIVILGVLATVTVFAVRGIADKGEQSACDADKKTIETAEEANMAQNGAYATEAELVTNGLLREVSPNADVTLGTDGNGKPDYTITGVGTCAPAAATTTTAPGATTTVASGPVFQSIPGLFPDFPVRSITGTGLPIVAIVGWGPGNTIAQNWLATLSQTPATARYVIIDTATSPAIANSVLLDNISVQADKVIWVSGLDGISDGIISAPDVLFGNLGPSRVSIAENPAQITAALAAWDLNG